MKTRSYGLVLLVILAAFAVLSSRGALGPPDPRPGVTVEPGPTSVPSSYGQGAVSVPATVLWSAPGQMREYDSLVLKENNEPAAWAGGMDTTMRLWLVEKADSMALYGEPVVILERRGDWLKVAVKTQKTTLNDSGYPGWVPAAHISSSDVYLREIDRLPLAVVSKKATLLYSDTELAHITGEVSYQTRLPLLEEKERAVMVRLPAGATGYLPRQDVKNTGELVFNPAGIVDEARQFVGLPYLWAGTASYGFDCSGFTMRLYQSQGIAIPRDADEQARAGHAVDRKDLLPGDLLFYAAKGGRGQIYHVGMYIGEGLMIHAPNSSTSVRIDPLDSGRYGEEYWGARRYAR